MSTVGSSSSSSFPPPLSILPAARFAGVKSETAAAMTRISQRGKAFATFLLISSADTTLSTRSTGGGARSTDPCTSVTFAPISTAARASAKPILPEDLFEIYLTSSISSSVRPAVTSTRTPESSSGAKEARIASTISSGSAIRPGPVSPHARSPSPGSIIRRPSRSSIDRLRPTAGFSHIPAFMAGANRTGQRAAASTVPARSSAAPWAAFERISAVAGATTTRSAQDASSTCSTPGSFLGAKRSHDTGLPERTSNVSGVTNSVAASLMTTRTRAPSRRSSLTR